MSQPSQVIGHSTNTIKRRPCVLLIQYAHQKQIVFVQPYWLIVPAGSVHSEQLTLPPYAQERLLRSNPNPLFLKRIGQRFFLANHAPQ